MLLSTWACDKLLYTKLLFPTFVAVTKIVPCLRSYPRLFLTGCEQETSDMFSGFEFLSGV
ncbi:MAG: hypothetical protein K0R08_1058 [Solimicrobium sp.]|nr:hypothetical protein [Solimicrobium sp.]